MDWAGFIAIGRIFWTLARVGGIFCFYSRSKQVTKQSGSPIFLLKN